MDALGQKGIRKPAGARSHCRIVETTVLELPNRTTLSTVSVGDLLKIELRSAPNRLVAMAKIGSAAGSINSPLTQEITQCILEGHQFVAEVLQLRGTTCKVRVRRRAVRSRLTVGYRAS